MKFNRLIPELTVRDIEKSLRFYVEILGFVIEYRRRNPGFAFVSMGEIQFMLDESRDSAWSTGKMEYPLGRGVNFSIEVEDLEKVAADLSAGGISLKMKPEEKWYRMEDKMLGERHLLVMDPDGYLLRFMEDLGEKEN